MTGGKATAAPLSMPAAAQQQGLPYGLLGFALAFVALPLYVQLPAFYADRLSLNQIGVLLLLARLGDALIDPWLGGLCDRWLALPAPALFLRLGAAAITLAAAFWALFHPPAASEGLLLLWCAVGLLFCYLSFSLLSVCHQAWAARLGGGVGPQARLSAWREGLALAGVLCASLLPGWLGFGGSAAVLSLALALGLLGLARCASPCGTATGEPIDAWLPWRTPGFKSLLAVFLLNGIAAAIPATLLLFFVRDRLQTPAAEGLYLACYFLAAAASLPLWLRTTRRLGPERSWGLGMLAAALSFIWAASLPAGAQTGFVLVCLASGLALGADLCIAPALLARLLQAADLQGAAEGRFFGWWNFASKLNLALAAGLALPLLQSLGYRPGQADADSQSALAWAYCVLPCLLKLAAAGLLYLLLIRPALDRSGSEPPR
ncbi:MFS transporter [Paucibacter sp. APW11]|uniref:MFS transporter n=1 Tax=Roseateles aquae TaxID=3077235 RepID=A0ABU3PB50_9BURK|nr:MFS transporter [Paucibacter sp. APW11]MDT8999465.1 MFS transporter [Paucibacter sp. APW11]